MSDENTHAVPDSSQEPEQRRNIEPKVAENSANPTIVPESSVPLFWVSTNKAIFIHCRARVLAQPFI